MHDIYITIFFEKAMNMLNDLAYNLSPVRQYPPLPEPEHEGWLKIYLLTYFCFQILKLNLYLLLLQLYIYFM